MTKTEQEKQTDKILEQKTLDNPEAPQQIKQKKNINYKNLFMHLIFLVSIAIFFLSAFKHQIATVRSVYATESIFPKQEIEESSETAKKSADSNNLQTEEETSKSEDAKFLMDINILVAGMDNVEGSSRSDSLFLLGLAPSKSRVVMLSIPRDTRVITDKSRKINEMIPRYGTDGLIKLLEDFLDIKISRHIRVDYKAFQKIIDRIGGVEIDVEKDMDYDDNAGNLHIHIKKGKQILDGEQSLHYVRFRADAMADLGRIKRQQHFMQALVKQFISPKNLINLPSIIKEAYSYIRTDFTIAELLAIAKAFDYKVPTFVSKSLPGTARYIDKISYFIPSAIESRKLAGQLFSHSVFEASADLPSSSAEFPAQFPKSTTDNKEIDSNKEEPAAENSASSTLPLSKSAKKRALPQDSAIYQEDETSKESSTNEKLQADQTNSQTSSSNSSGTSDSITDKTGKALSTGTKPLINSAEIISSPDTAKTSVTKIETTNP